MRRFVGASAALAFAIIAASQAAAHGPLNHHGGLHFGFPSGFLLNNGFGSFSIYQGPVYGFGYLPPLSVPAGGVYGPQAMQDFMGLNQGAVPNVAPRRGAQQPVPGVNGGGKGGLGGPAPGGQAPNDPGAKPKARASNDEAKARAWEFIGFGDTQFRKQQFSDANARYRKASEAAPDVPETLFRQGFSWVTLGKYDMAAKTFKRGLQFDPAWPRSNFRLDLLYADNKLAKHAHFEAMGKAAAEQADHPDLLFVVGVMLHFDGQQDRARPFFQRAKDLSFADLGHLDAFLKPLPTAPAAKPPGLDL